MVTIAMLGRGLVGSIVACGLLVACARIADEPAAGDAPPVPTARALYDRHCAACHGEELQGQPGWQTARPDGTFPAPPLDGMGHTWHHPDPLLHDIIARGGAVTSLPIFPSAMPGFGQILSDAEIQAVLAYIKDHWPPDKRASQEWVSRMNARSRTRPDREP